MVNAVELTPESPGEQAAEVPSQAAIGRALGLSPAAITKLKGKGMPVDSVANAQAWRVARQNVAQRKPLPAAASIRPMGARVSGTGADGMDGLPGVTAAGGRAEAGDFGGFFPRDLPAGDMAPWLGGGRGSGDGGGDGRSLGGCVMLESFEEARIRHKVAEANLAELEEARIKGLHVEKTKVDMAFFEAARGLRDGMTNCSRRLAAEVATLGTPSECEVVIARELRHLLESFTRQLMQKAGMPVVEDVAP